MSHIIGLDHMQVAIPKGEEDRARAFYTELLGLTEIPKPAETAGRGGLWLECGALQVHLGVEEPFAPARKAHPAFRVVDYKSLLDKLSSAGYQVKPDTALPDVERAFVNDPFGNRVELINVEDDL
ncbi:MAG: VOC family protein [Pseudomonadota bacterium]